MQRRKFVGLLVSAQLMASAGRAQSVMADLIVLYKSERKLQLFNNNRLLRSYDVELGFSPVGHKEEEGDGRTPEGAYIINRRNENSTYHLSLGLSYPDVNDFAAARARGRHPGGNIFIHGGPILAGDRNKADWTAGCISVTNREIEEIWSLVPLNTLIVIEP